MSEEPNAGHYSPERLREDALKRLRQRRPQLDRMPPQDVESMVHELEIQHVELQMQNEELQRTQTALEKAHERYRNLYEFAPVGYLTLDIDGKITRGNLAASNITGWPRRDLLNLRFEKLAAVEVRDECYMHLRETWNTKSKSVRELPFSKPDGTRYWAHVESVCTNEDNDQNAYRVTITDVTDRKEAEEKLQKLSRSLEQRVRQRTDQLQDQSRRLRNLVVQLADAEDRERRRIAELLHDDLQQILLGSRYHMEIAMGMIDNDRPHSLLKQALGMVTEAIEKARDLSHELRPPALKEQGLPAGLEWLSDRMHDQHGLEVDLECRGDFENQPEPIDMLFYRAAHELLFNAVKHSGLRECRLSLKRLEDKVRLEVSDSGVGFDLPMLKGSQNTGLGLISIRERVEGIGGHVEIQSVPGDGVKVRVEIPEAQIQAYRRDKKSSDPETSGPGADSKQPTALEEILRIVVADDHQVMREGLVRLLNGEQDLEVVGEASTGAEAIEQVQRLKPDVVIMDFSMPGMSGDKATREIRNRFRKVRMIGLSMFNDNIGASRMIEAGVEAYLPKAGPCEDLLRAIRSRKTTPKK